MQADSGQSGGSTAVRQTSPDNYDELSDAEENEGFRRPLQPTAMRSVLLDDERFAPSSEANPMKRALYDLLEEPTSSSAAFLIHVFTTALIVISAIITVLETLPPFHRTPSGVWFGLETALVVCFTFEYMGRFYAHSESWEKLWAWFGSFFAIVDLLAIGPYYVEIAVQADTTTFFRFSILRTFRLLRVFRPFKYSNTILLTIEVMYLSMKRSKDALLALGFFVLMALVVFSTLLYFAERGIWDAALETFVDADGDPSQFESIPAAAWFVLVTITTVGYGEIIPRSVLGRLITIPLLLFGLLLIALPSFVLGREFAALWDGMALRGKFPSARARASSLDAFIDAHTSRESRQAISARHRTTPSDPEAHPLRSIPRQTDVSASIQSIDRDLIHDSGNLSNRRLARNQQVLSKQIDELGSLMREMRKELRVLRRGKDADRRDHPETGDLGVGSIR